MGKSEGEIEAEIKRERSKKLEQLKAQSQVMDLKDKHQAAFAKHQEIDKLGRALNIGKDFEGGAAFDFELQERKREQKLAEKD